MSQGSYTSADDRNDLLYISRRIYLQEKLPVEEEIYAPDSSSEESEVPLDKLESDIRDLYLRCASEGVGPQTYKDPEIVAKATPFQQEITCISSDNSGQWLVTASGDQDGCFIVWDSLAYKSVFAVFVPYPQRGILLVQISGSARYLITIGADEADENYNVDLWLWTLGSNKPDCTFKADKHSGLPVAICFNPDIEEHIMVAFEKNVYLVNWNSETKSFSTPVVPQIMHKNKLGHITGATYLNSCHECYASSSKGCLLIFGNTLYPKPFEEGELDNVKIFRNALRVSPVAIGCCTSIDGLLVIGDTRGNIFFFDSRVRILYWLKNYSLSAITSISFNSVPKLKMQDGNTMYIPKLYQDRIFECGYEDITSDLELIFKQDLPTDATLKRNAFVIRDFFVSTTDSNIYAIDCVNDQCIPLFFVADANVKAIEVHDELLYLIIAYANGRLMMIDYDKNELINSTILPATHDSDEARSVSCIKYSPDSMHLVCSRDNGEIWILEPILLIPKTGTPFRPTKCKPLNLKFATCTTQFAYYDSNRTVVIFTYDVETSEWRFAGKIRSHYDDINDLLFMPAGHSSTLYTISKDRHIVEYNNQKLNQEDFGIVTRERIEQTAMPMNFIYWFECSETTKKHSGYFIIADDQFVPKTDIRYMIFMTKKHIGLQIVPTDGNPFKYVGYLIHPTEVVDFKLSPDGKYTFTFGKDDHSVFKWEIKPKAVELMNLLGGKELEPFYCLIEGGKNGWLFQEIKDLFYYMQILNQENFDLPRRVSDSINLSELPDLVRTCGFYPSEFELENMMIDIKYRNYNETGHINEEVNFIDFVKLFCNHKPVYGYPKDKVEQAFNILEESGGKGRSGGISKDEFVQTLATAGECLSHSNIDKYLKTLLRVSPDEDETAEYLPEEINFQTFYDDILGIDMNRGQLLEGIGNESDEESDVFNV